MQSSHKIDCKLSDSEMDDIGEKTNIEVTKLNAQMVTMRVEMTGAIESSPCALNCTPCDLNCSVISILNVTICAFSFVSPRFVFSPIISSISISLSDKLIFHICSQIYIL